MPKKFCFFIFHNEAKTTNTFPLCKKIFLTSAFSLNILKIPNKITTEPITPSQSGAYFSLSSPAALYIEIKNISNKIIYRGNKI